jgi:DNA replication and repair protein RecF
MKIAADGIDLRKFGSQGQQRTAALSLKLSEIKLIGEETGEKPILLLDDVLSELDNDRQTYLINSLGGNQLFITTTDISGKVAKSLPEGKVFKINSGNIEIEI